jgi:hypothetical protein
MYLFASALAAASLNGLFEHPARDACNPNFKSQISNREAYAARNARKDNCSNHLSGKDTLESPCSGFVRFQ